MKLALKSILGATVLVAIAAAFFAAMNATLIKNQLAYDNADIAQTSGLAALQDVPGAPDTVPLAADTGEAALFDPVAQAAFEDGGKAIIVWHDGKIVFETYAQGIGADTRFKSFSLHKSVVGLVAATMASEGLISLDDLISDYVPDFTGGGRETLTLRDALTHQTGLERYTIAPPDWRSLQLLMSHRIEKTALSTQKVSDAAVFDYGNANYQIAGAALRNALDQKLGMSYADYLSTRIWAPIGANDAALWAESRTGAPRFYSGLFASARDWLRVGILLADSGRIEGDQVLAPSVISTVTTPSQGNPGYGLGTWLGGPADGTREYGPSTALSVLHSAPYADNDVVFFDGFGGQRVYISPSRRLVVVRFGNPSFTFDDARIYNLAAAAVARLSRDVGATDDSVTTPAGRIIPVRIIAPVAACDCKTLLFSPGAFASPSRYDELLFRVAAQGIRIIVPHHVDSEEYPGETKYPHEQWMPLRIEDVRTIAESYGLTEMDSSDWAVGGHSFGALIAQIYGVSIPEPDQRPGSILALSPPGNAPGINYDTLMPQLESPMLVVTGTQDVLEGMVENWCDHLYSHSAAPNRHSRALVFENADHYFNGYYGRPKPRDDKPFDEILAAEMVSFISGPDMSSAASDKIEYISLGDRKARTLATEELCPLQ